MKKEMIKFDDFLNQLIKEIFYPKMKEKGFYFLWEDEDYEMTAIKDDRFVPIIKCDGRKFDPCSIVIFISDRNNNNIIMGNTIQIIGLKDFREPSDKIASRKDFISKELATKQRKNFEKIVDYVVTEFGQYNKDFKLCDNLDKYLVNGDYQNLREKDLPNLIIKKNSL